LGISSWHEELTFKEHNYLVNSACFSPDGHHILSGSKDSTLKLWDTETGKELCTFKGHDGTVWSVCFSPEGTHILSGSSDHTLKIWNIETGACIKTIPLLWIPLEIKAHPTKPGIFATANANGTVTFFDFREILGISKK
jgi:WD40 repeat protein